MSRIFTLEQLAEALADGLRLEDPTQRGRGLSETEALELIVAGAELICPGGPDLAEEVPRKQGRSGVLNDLAVFADLIAPILPHLDRPGWALEVFDRHAAGPINADRPLYPMGSPDAVRPGDPIDFKTTFESPRCVHHTTSCQHAKPHRVERGSWLAWNGSAAALPRAVEQNQRAIRLALIPPSRS